MMINDHNRLETKLASSDEKARENAAALSSSTEKANQVPDLVAQLKRVWCILPLQGLVYSLTDNVML
jgi:hypothetical protein